MLENIHQINIRGSAFQLSIVLLSASILAVSKGMFYASVDIGLTSANLDKPKEFNYGCTFMLYELQTTIIATGISVLSASSVETQYISPPQNYKHWQKLEKFVKREGNIWD
jgi:hypothetical protein